MDIKLVGLAFTAIVLCTAQPLAAEMRYEATRFNSKTGARTLDVRILIGAQDLRVDVTVDGLPLLSAIETPDRLIVMDDIAGIYSVRATLTRAGATPRLHRTTSRSLSALGSYCNVAESRWSEKETQERCLVPTETQFESSTRIHRGTWIGEILAAIAACENPLALFELATRALTEASLETSFPVIIRHSTSNGVIGELRVLRVVNVAPLRNTFNMPRGYQPISQQRLSAIQASRQVSLSDVIEAERHAP
ncbi:MAG: hypothetical protein H7Y02_06735 [Candidatus Obscuribacterales bacterium]|nr:hypothetical protein [Steroidobacteraceae bacterium]